MDEKAKRLQCVSDFQKACAAEAETNVDAFRQSFYNLCPAYIQGSGVSLEQAVGGSTRWGQAVWGLRSPLKGICRTWKSDCTICTCMIRYL